MTAGFSRSHSLYTTGVAAVPIREEEMKPNVHPMNVREFMQIVNIATRRLYYDQHSPSPEWVLCTTIPPTMVGAWVGLERECRGVTESTYPI
jgi:hypothetical protein